MIRHIVTLLWNRKRSYLSILVEQVAAFIILTICLITLVGAVKQYHSPGLLETRNILYFGYMMHSDFTQGDVDRMSRQMEVILEDLRRKDYVIAVSRSMNFIPYMRSDEYYLSDSIVLSSDRKVFAQYRFTDESAADVFDIEMLNGRWIKNDEVVDGRYHAVVTKQFVEAAKIDQPIGKTFQYGPWQFEIVGVIEGLKSSVFDNAKPAIIIPISLIGDIFASENVAKLKPGYEDRFYSDYIKELNRLTVGLGSKVEPMMDKLSSWRNRRMIDTINKVAFLSIPTLFLLIFAFIGTMGLTLINLKTRIPELAVRIAIGSTNGQLMRFVILQNLVITLIALIPGFIIALSVYEWSATNLTAIGLAVSVMLLFSILSSWYPIRTIARLSPAQALKNE